MAAVVLVSIAWITIFVPWSFLGVWSLFSGPAAALFALGALIGNRGTHRRVVGVLAGLVCVLVIVGTGVAFGVGLHDLGEDTVSNGSFSSSPTTTIPPSGGRYIDTHGSDCPAAQQGHVPKGEPARLYGCDLSYVDLSHATLTGAELSTANLAHAVLVGADLSEADLSSSNLWGVDVTDANLSGARFTDASLTGIVWSDTTCPDGSNSDSHGDTCVGYGI